MASEFKKCIDITPSAIRTPGNRQDYLWLRAQEWWEELLVDTRCIRFWAYRPALQGDVANYPLGAAPEGTIEALRLRNLDAQIRAANADGLEVILLPYTYPRAANGTLNLPVDNRLFEPQDRASGNAYLTWYYDRSQTVPNMKDLAYRLPPDGHGPDSDWGRFVRAMFERWVVRGDVHGHVNVIEVCNEPNGQPAAARASGGREHDRGPLRGQPGTAVPGQPPTHQRDDRPASRRRDDGDRRRVRARLLTTSELLRARHGGQRCDDQRVISPDEQVRLHAV